jgi:hypothetical protein
MLYCSIKIYSKVADEVYVMRPYLALEDFLLFSLHLYSKASHNFQTASILVLF